MKEHFGISASPGIAIGKAFLYLEENLKIPSYTIHDDETDGEVSRFHKAVERAREEILALKKRAEAEMAANGSEFLDSHILMLSDPEFKDRVESDVRTLGKNVESILYTVIEELIEKLDSSTDAYLRERTIDIHDVSKRILNQLLYRERISLADLNEEVILVTQNLLPTDALLMNKRMVKGLIMDAGGKTSHTAILARSFEIPAILGLGDIARFIRYGQDIIVDGNSGKVILGPDDSTVSIYKKAKHEWEQREIQLLALNELPAETTDGKHIDLKANIEVPEEVDSVLSHGADGVGLYRSEFLFLRPGALPTEEEQYKAYSQVLQGMADKPVTIRTLDIGGDKVISEMDYLHEKNPILGWRAIRFCLSNDTLFKTQLRALLRASVHGELRIMFPMISGIEELDAALEILEVVKQDLDQKGVEYSRNIPVGIMVEVPSAAMTADILAKSSDFFSIGTNDLIQYTIAVDRGNEKIAYLYEPFHPGVIKMIKNVIEAAHVESIPVGMCGEMAGDPMASVILLGLGLDEYSMSSFSIPEVKRLLRNISVYEAEELVGTVFDMRSSKEVDSYVRTWMEERFEFL